MNSHRQNLFLSALVFALCAGAVLSGCAQTCECIRQKEGETAGERLFMLRTGEAIAMAVNGQLARVAASMGYELAAQYNPKPCKGEGPGDCVEITVTRRKDAPESKDDIAATVADSVRTGLTTWERAGMHGLRPGADFKIVVKNPDGTNAAEHIGLSGPGGKA